MQEYQLEIRQRDFFPRCRICREMIQTLTADRDIHTNGYPGLFAFIALCYLASSRMTSMEVEGIGYTMHPGEYIRSTEELRKVLRLRSNRQVLDVLRAMQDQGLLQLTLLNRGNMVLISIQGWRRCHQIQSNDCPNQALAQFFFLPAATAAKLISSVKCSEMDILLDLFCSAVYRDERVSGSYFGPAVYFRNGTGNAAVTYENLCKRWRLSHEAVRRILHKFRDAGYINLCGSPCHPEMMIYLADKLSPVFQVSDILVDKDELPMYMRMRLSSVPGELPGIIDVLAEKVLHLLDLQGISCAKCRQCTHELCLVYQSPTVSEKNTHFRMDILCGHNTSIYSFDLLLSPCES